MSNLVLCDNLEGWNDNLLRGRFKRVRMYTHIYPWLMCVVRQNPMQHCEAILQLKKKIICSVFDYAILTGGRWYLIVILICISLMLSIVEHLFVCLIVIYIYLVKCLFRASAYILMDCLFFFNIEVYELCVYVEY